MISDEIKYIDFHCHCDLLPGFESSSLKLSPEVAAVAVTTTPLAWPKNKEESQRISGLLPALGMHPQLISARYKDHYSFSKYINDAFIVGEIGLDGSTAFKDSLNLQEEVLSKILDLSSASKTAKILSIHSLKAETRLINILKVEMNATSLTPIMHWFTGSLSQASKLLDLGAKFSFNHKMVKTKKGQSLIAHIPKDSILIETDLPFSANTYNSEYHKSLLKDTATELATSLGVPSDDFKATLLQNSRKLLHGT
ncbi:MULTISPECIES: TatD family hydrolase [unclassified Vibrio]|uniref:TatD family hydrolase n=1 Tax=unclassified Vibrio TaxID=2614977 RepID=UPI00352E2771